MKRENIVLLKGQRYKVISNINLSTRQHGVDDTDTRALLWLGWLLILNDKTMRTTTIEAAHSLQKTAD
jgi:hypothetical protein